MLLKADHGLHCLPFQDTPHRNVTQTWSFFGINMAIYYGMSILWVIGLGCANIRRHG